MKKENQKANAKCYVQNAIEYSYGLKAIVSLKIDTRDED